MCVLEIPRVTKDLALIWKKYALSFIRAGKEKKMGQKKYFLDLTTFTGGGGEVARKRVSVCERPFSPLPPRLVWQSFSFALDDAFLYRTRTFQH